MQSQRRITRCGLCSDSVQGAVRELNRHKAVAHPIERKAARDKRKARVANRGVSMNRCESCGTFVSLEPGEPEENDISVDEEGNISGSVRMSLNCGSCGGELAETEAEIADVAEIQHEEDCGEPDLSIDTSGFELEESGGGRFSKHLYYVTGSALVKCETCAAEAAIDLESYRVSASAFESCQ